MSEFKVGDKVIIKESLYYSVKSVGKTGTVVEGGKNPVVSVGSCTTPHSQIDKDNFCYTFLPDMVELIKENTMTEPKVGQKFLASSETPFMARYTSTVCEYIGNNAFKMHDGNTQSNRSFNGLTPVNEEVYEKAWADYDRKVINKFTYEGKEYIVTSDTDDDTLNVDTAEGLAEDEWTLKGDTAEVQEVTLDDIATKFGVDVSKIRIKE